MEIFFAVHDCATLKGSWTTEVSSRNSCRSTLKSFNLSLIHAVRMCPDQSESFEAKEAATAQEKKKNGGRCVDATTAAVLSEAGDIFSLKKGERRH